MRITAEYMLQNAQLHIERSDYGTRGARWERRIVQIAFKWCWMIERNDQISILDYGCGKGTLQVKNADMKRYDPAIPEYASEPQPAEIVVCTDVLEHVEPECLDAVLAHLAEMTQRILFIFVATRKASKLLPDGRNTHQIVEPMEWWIGHMRRLFVGFKMVDIGGDDDRYLSHGFYTTWVKGAAT